MGQGGRRPALLANPVAPASCVMLRAREPFHWKQASPVGVPSHRKGVCGNTMRVRRWRLRSIGHIVDRTAEANPPNWR
jgi:hypothetical protein